MLLLMVLRLRGNAIGRAVKLSREVIVFSLSPTAKSQYKSGLEARVVCQFLEEEGLDIDLENWQIQEEQKALPGGQADTIASL